MDVPGPDGNDLDICALTSCCTTVQSASINAGSILPVAVPSARDGGVTPVVSDPDAGLSAAMCELAIVGRPQERNHNTALLANIAAALVEGHYW